MSRRPEGLAGRCEDTERLVSTHFQKFALELGHFVAHDPGKTRRQLGRRLVTLLLGESREPAHICDEECADRAPRSPATLSVAERQTTFGRFSEFTSTKRTTLRLALSRATQHPRWIG